MPCRKAGHLLFQDGKPENREKNGRQHVGHLDALAGTAQHVQRHTDQDNAADGGHLGDGGLAEGRAKNPGQQGQCTLKHQHKQGGTGHPEAHGGAEGLNTDYRALVNPTGRFVTGGSFADSGVTGRKIIADTYGGAAHHGGGAFSGKDPTKVDRSAAYMARRIAKDVLRAGYAKRCEIQLSYAIGIEEPVSILVNTFHTGRVPAGYIVKWIRKHYDLTPEGMISFLGLQHVDYNYTSTLGHFWRQWLPWEDESTPYENKDA